MRICPSRLIGPVLLLAVLPARAADQPGLTFIRSSTTKLEQLIGDTDKQRRAPTLTQSFSRYGIEGTDLGYSFEHNGQVFFLFGDTLGRRGGDVIGTTRATDPERGVRLDFLTDSTGQYLRVQPPGISMRGFEVPVSGISLDGKLYIVVRTNHSEDRASPTDMSVLTSYDEERRAFKTLRTISKLPAGKVITMSMHLTPQPMPELPSRDPHVLIWSSATYRTSNAYLSIVPAATFESGKGTRYFAGLDASQRPTWSDRETDAKPVVDHPTIGDLSVIWTPALRLWLMTYDSRDPRGIVFRYSATPWGPWSAAQIIFMPQEGRGFIHRAGTQDGLSGPVIAREGRGNPDVVPGGAYAPYMIERFTKLDGNRLSIYYVLSTWNPYVVVLMRSSFLVE